MSGTLQLIFIIIVTNAGGQGKTTLARLLKTLFELVGQPVQLLDSDAGNAAAKVIDASAKKIGWGVDTLVAPEIVATCAGQHVILDLGANALASAREIAAMTPELAKRFKAAGYRNVAFLPVTPNKPGATEAVLHLAEQLPPMERILVRNDIDGSGQFEAIATTDPVVDLKHLQPGYMSYVNEGGLTFLEAVQQPAPDRTEAGRVIAEWLGDFAKQTQRHGLFVVPAAKLELHPRPRGAANFMVKTAAAATDQALAENQRKSRLLTLLNRHGWTPVGLRIRSPTDPN